jgi:hypothetical protein
MIAFHAPARTTVITVTATMKTVEDEQKQVK